MLYILAFLIPMAAGILAATVPAKSDTRRRGYYIAALLLSDLCAVGAMLQGGTAVICSFSDTVRLSFSMDGFGRLCQCIVLFLYTVVCFYAFEYMKKEEQPNRFFAFYFVSMGAMNAVCMADNLVTLYFCFELATLSTVPLVLHELSRDAIAAGLKYLFYSIGGALLGLFAIFFVYEYAAGAPTFVLGGSLDKAALAGHEPVFLAAMFVGIIGFGTKAGMYPMHGWLPAAHPIAPAPASALLSGIIAKAGVIAVIRLVYYSVGAEVLAGTWVQTAWMILALITIFMGSMMAYKEKIIKKRLAYSTVSQISYIMLSLSFLSMEGLTGGMLHVMAHAAAKGCLFLVAGIFIYKWDIRQVADLKGIGQKMPVTLWCFMISALSLVGIPPMGGFTSKWVIAETAVTSGIPVFQFLAPAVLLLSALLTAGYLFPIVIDGFFPGHGAEVKAQKKDEASAWMLVPLILLCAAGLFVGLFGHALVCHVFGL